MRNSARPRVCDPTLRLKMRLVRAISLKIPNSNTQIPDKSQAPNFKLRQSSAPPFGPWDLEISWSLSFGIWSFRFSGHRHLGFRVSALAALYLLVTVPI